MSAIAIDTHEFFNQLKNVGFSIEQAEVIAQMQKTTSKATIEQAKNDYHLDEIATKRDLKELETTLELKIELVRADLRRDTAENKAELVRWVIGAGFLQVALIAGLMLRLADKL
jgi:DNA-binding transcriptional MerR regulator